MRNLVVLGGTSHPFLVQAICHRLGLTAGKVDCEKFSNGETSVRIRESVREKDVYIITSGCGNINEILMELLIMIHACKIASAKKVTVVLPIFPYSRNADVPRVRSTSEQDSQDPAMLFKDSYAFEQLPNNNHTTSTDETGLTANKSQTNAPGGVIARSQSQLSLPNTFFAAHSNIGMENLHINEDVSQSDYSNLHPNNNTTTNATTTSSSPSGNASYRQWIAQAGTLVADMLICAGANHIITMDLHDPQFQGFFDIPVDNLFGKPLLQRYITAKIPDYRNAVIVSPDAGGAKRATAIADALGMDFAMIHKERRFGRVSGQKHNLILVGNVENKVAIMIDDLADTARTLCLAADLLASSGAVSVYALITHGILSGDALDMINQSVLDRVVVTNTAPQEANLRRSRKLEVIDVAPVFAEAIRRSYNGETLSLLFDAEYES